VTSSKRLLFLPLLLTMVFALSSVFTLFRPATSIAFTKTDTMSFLWSGKTEGETIVAVSDEPSSTLTPPAPSFSRFPLDTGINEARKSFGSFLLPALLPQNMRYADVYLGPVVIVVYGETRSEDYRSGMIGIEIAPGPYREPSVEELRQYLLPGLKLIQIGDIWVTLNDQAHDWEREELYILATFYHTACIMPCGRDFH
jgi:hypothetical protein